MSGWFVAAAVATVVGAGISAVGTIQQGRAQAAQAKFAAQEAELNRRRAAANAQAEADNEVRLQSFLERDKKSMLATQKTAVAASGLELSGSNLDLMLDTDLNFELEKADSRQRSYLKRHQYITQARDFGVESQMQIVASKNARTSSYYGAGGTLLSGAGSAMAIASSRRTGIG